MTLLLILSTLTFIVAVLITWWVHSRVEMDIRVTPAPWPVDHPAALISVIIPARNEARNIRRCIESLLAQTYPNYEMIVVDDRSTDGTSEILAQIQREPADRTRQGYPAPSVQVVHGVDLPDGWAGKPHALHQGVAIATGDGPTQNGWYCFIDADTFAYPELLSSTYLTATQHGADMFSMLTRQELVSFWERVILPLVFTALSIGFPFERVNDPSKPDAIANGQFILIRREAYEAVGGHKAIKGRIDEDRALAATVKGAGYRLLIANGWEAASTRMYTTLPEIWEGWTKNIFLGMRDQLGLLSFGAFVGLLGALALPAWLLLGLMWLLIDGSLAAAIVVTQAVLAWALLIYYRVQAADAFNIPRAYALTLPLGSLMLTAMMFASTYKVLSGQGVSWRGRTYK
jgi:chlorobactene glucosyltransferase